MGGEILRYRSRPRHRGEILCHNHVAIYGNGFRYFVARRSRDWRRCKCGWRPELGPHYAIPREEIKRIAAELRGEP